MRQSTNADVKIRNIIEKYNCRRMLCDSAPVLGSESDSFLQWLKGCKKNFLFFLSTYPQALYLQSLIYCFKDKLCVKILFCKHFFRPLNTFMRKGKDPDPDLDHWLTDPDPQNWLYINFLIFWMAQGEAVPVHGLVLAAASPYLAHLISSSPEGDPHDVIILDSVQTNQVAVLHLM